MQADFVTALARTSHLKAALLTAKDLGLHAQFPELELQHRRAVVEDLLLKGRWLVATGFVGGDRALQERLVCWLAAQGDASAAQQYALQYGLGEGFVAGLDGDADLKAEADRYECAGCCQSLAGLTDAALMLHAVRQVARRSGVCSAKCAGPCSCTALLPIRNSLTQLSSQMHRQ